MFSVSRKHLFCFVLVLFAGLPLPAQAQDQCTRLVTEALSAVDAACEGAVRNEACYGNRLVAGEFRQTDAALSFEQVGDIASLFDLRRIRTSPLNLDDAAWGIALLRLQANLPDSLPGQSLAVLLLGDTDLTDRYEPPPRIRATTSGPTNVRGGPATSVVVLTSLAANATVDLNGRNDAGDWLRFTLPDRRYGWVSASTVRVDGDPLMLPTVRAADLTAPEQTSPRPMQIFYLQSGRGQTVCADAPPDGLLVQTPRGGVRVELRANEADIVIGSTAFMQAQPDDALILSVIEGWALVTVAGETSYVPAGTRTSIVLDTDGVATVPPGVMERYTEADLSALPVALLDRQIEIAPPLGDAVITRLLSPILPSTQVFELEPVRVEGLCFGEALPVTRLRQTFVRNPDGSLQVLPAATPADGFRVPDAIERATNVYEWDESYQHPDGDVGALRGYVFVDDSQEIRIVTFISLERTVNDEQQPCFVRVEYAPVDAGDGAGTDVTALQAQMYTVSAGLNIAVHRCPVSGDAALVTPLPQGYAIDFSADSFSGSFVFDTLEDNAFYDMRTEPRSRLDVDEDGRLNVLLGVGPNQSCFATLIGPDAR